MTTCSSLQIPAGVVTVVLAALLNDPALADNPAPRGFAAPRNRIIMPYSPDDNPGWAHRGEVYPCLGETVTGYSILLSRSNAQAIAVVPFHDEWGRPAATAWEHSSELAENTIKIEAPVQLRPGALVLKKNARYPVVSTSSDSYALLYQFENFSATVRVFKAAVVFEPAAGENVSADDSSVEQSPQKDLLPQKDEPPTAGPKPVTGEKVARDDKPGLKDVPTKIDADISKPTKPVEADMPQTGRPRRKPDRVPEEKKDQPAKTPAAARQPAGNPADDPERTDDSVRSEEVAE